MMAKVSERIMRSARAAASSGDISARLTPIPDTRRDGEKYSGRASPRKEENARNAPKIQPRSSTF